jgi:hypothetical protein
MDTLTARLDQLLPMLDSHRSERHDNVAVLEVTDAAHLLELAANGKIRRYLLARLSQTTALVDPGHAEALTRALLAEGHTPKMVRGITS